MKRLRHPVRGIREPFGTAGLVVACIALVLALTGAAFAAAGLNGKQKKEVEKIAKKFAGKPGAQGATGPQGSAGATGKEGANGTPGTNGTNGTNGSNGVSPTGTEFAGSKSGHCSEGGVEFKGTNTTFACNGVKGQTGFTATLPAGKTETGTWAESLQEVEELALARYAISFPIPLAEGSLETEEKVVFLNVAETEKEASERVHGVDCPGSLQEPEAAAGFLCVYTAEAEGHSGGGAVEEPTIANFSLEGGAYSPTGALMGWVLSGPGAEMFWNGTWAVTAPTT